jgi:hypothetical protein
MMFLLVSYITRRPIQVTSGRTNHAITDLPVQRLLTQANLLIHRMRRATLELTDPRADHQRGRNGHRDMHVILGTANFMDDHVG